MKAIYLIIVFTLCLFAAQFQNSPKWVKALIVFGLMIALGLIMSDSANAQARTFGMEVTTNAQGGCTFKATPLNNTRGQVSASFDMKNTDKLVLALQRGIKWAETNATHKRNFTRSLINDQVSCYQGSRQKIVKIEFTGWYNGAGTGFKIEVIMDNYLIAVLQNNQEVNNLIRKFNEESIDELFTYDDEIEVDTTVSTDGDIMIDYGTEEEPEIQFDGDTVTDIKDFEKMRRYVGGINTHIVLDCDMTWRQLIFKVYHINTKNSKFEETWKDLVLANCREGLISKDTTYISSENIPRGFFYIPAITELKTRHSVEEIKEIHEWSGITTKYEPYESNRTKP
ncbi:MAG: hypothetical protein ACPGED_06735 [Flavobacteriales bacterium]